MFHYGRLRRLEARLARLEGEVMNQVDFQAVLVSLKQAVVDVGNRVAAKLTDLENQIAAGQKVDLTAEAASINEDIASLAVIVPMPPVP
jgi:hypothetical protein